MRTSAATRQGKGDVTNISDRNVRLIAFPDAKAELSQQQPLSHALTFLYKLLEEYAPSWYTQRHHEIAESALNDLKQR